MEQRYTLLLEALQEIKKIVKPRQRFDDQGPSWGSVNERDIDVICDEVLRKVANGK